VCGIAGAGPLAERVEVTILLSPTAMTLDPLEVHVCKGTKMVVAGRSNFSLRSAVRGSPPPCGDMTPMGETDLGICRVAFVIDGVRAHRAGTQRIDDLVPFSLVSAIEVYRTPAELPAEYSGYNSRCGVVAIWTRRGSS
jgi:hypothetical protein